MAAASASMDHDKGIRTSGRRVHCETVAIADADYLLPSQERGITATLGPTALSRARVDMNHWECRLMDYI